jgi:hypothetical protein
MRVRIPVSEPSRPVSSQSCKGTARLSKVRAPRSVPLLHRPTWDTTSTPDSTQSLRIRSQAEKTSYLRTFSFGLRILIRRKGYQGSLRPILEMLDPNLYCLGQLQVSDQLDRISR